MAHSFLQVLQTQSEKERFRKNMKAKLDKFPEEHEFLFLRMRGKAAKQRALILHTVVETLTEHTGQHQHQIMDVLVGCRYMTGLVRN